MATNHSRQQYHDVEIGFDGEGRIVALVDRFMVDMGAYIRTHGVIVPELTAALLPGPYRIPHYTARPAACSPTRLRRAPIAARAASSDSCASARWTSPPRRARHRPARAPPEKLHHGRRVALRGRRRLAEPEHRLRLRRLRLRPGQGAGAGRLRWRPARAGRGPARGPLRGHRRGLLVEKAGLGPWEYARGRSTATATSSSTPASPRSGRGSRRPSPRSCADELGSPPKRSPWSTATPRRCPSALGLRQPWCRRRRCPPPWRPPGRCATRSCAWRPASRGHHRRPRAGRRAVFVRGSTDKR